MLIDASGVQTRIQLQTDAVPFSIIGGPQDMIYGFAQAGTETAPAAGVAFAIPVTGDRRGQAVASAEIGMVSYVEAPVGMLQAGPDGVVNTRDGQVPLPYVLANGQPFEEALQRPTYFQDELGNIVEPGRPPKWVLDIERHPEFRGNYVGESPPVATADGGAAYWTAIGAPSDPAADFSDALLPMIAMLHPDGSGTWRSIPDGWSVSSMDTAGTVLTRRTDIGLDIAVLDPISESVWPFSPPAADCEWTLEQLDTSITPEVTNIVFAITNATDQICAAPAVSSIVGTFTDGPQREAELTQSRIAVPTTLAPGEALHMQISAVPVLRLAKCLALLSSISIVLEDGLAHEFELAGPIDACRGFLYEMITTAQLPSPDCSWSVEEKPGEAVLNTGIQRSVVFQPDFCAPMHDAFDQGDPCSFR